MLAAARSYGMSVTAYYAMANGKVPNEPLLADIGARYGKTAAQVVLRWLIQQQGVVALSKTATESRLGENFAVFDFLLTGDENGRHQRAGPARRQIVNPGHLAPKWIERGRRISKPMLEALKTTRRCRVCGLSTPLGLPAISPHGGRSARRYRPPPPSRPCAGSSWQGIGDTSISPMWGRCLARQRGVGRNALRSNLIDFYLVISPTAPAAG